MPPRFRGGRHRSTLELAKEISEFLEACNEDPKPFV